MSGKKEYLDLDGLTQLAKSSTDGAANQFARMLLDAGADLGVPLINQFIVATTSRKHRLLDSGYGQVGYSDLMKVLITNSELSSDGCRLLRDAQVALVEVNMNRGLHRVVADRYPEIGDEIFEALIALEFPEDFVDPDSSQAVRLVEDLVHRCSDDFKARIVELVPVATDPVMHKTLVIAAVMWADRDSMPALFNCFVGELDETLAAGNIIESLKALSDRWPLWFMAKISDTATQQQLDTITRALTSAKIVDGQNKSEIVAQLETIVKKVNEAKAPSSAAKSAAELAANANPPGAAPAGQRHR